MQIKHSYIKYINKSKKKKQRHKELTGSLKQTLGKPSVTRAVEGQNPEGVQGQIRSQLLTEGLPERGLQPSGAQP